MRCIDDLLNGNLTDAKVGAVNKSTKAIREALMNEYGYKEGSATVTANYLKGKATWEAHCNQLDRDNKAATEALEARLKGTQ